MKYKLPSDQKIFKQQLRGFINDTGFKGIFKRNLHKGNKIVGEEILGVTKHGQLVKITFDGEKMVIEL